MTVNKTSRIPQTPAEAERFLWHALEHLIANFSPGGGKAEEIILRALEELLENL
jgi:hypothetical protein